MNTAMLVLTWLLPLLLLPIAGQRYAGWSMLVAPLPALLAAIMVPVGTSISLPWLLLGSELGLDETGRVFLLFSGLLWLVAALYGAGSEADGQHGTRYRVFFLLAMAGNLALIVAGDMLSFYLGFTLMGLAACGLILHPATRRARKAARRYLAWTIAGELLLFVAVVMLAMQQGGVLNFAILQSSPPSGFVVLLLIIGFGIKLALPGLHLWLPQAYAVTPTPAVAVLSGAMIKAGLLGWLRFLPGGDAAPGDWGQVLLIVGVTGIFFGTIGGLLQQQPRILLGYSSIGKMGVLTTGMGAALVWPTAAPALTAALVLYAAHHALVKGALFLGLGLVERGGLRPWLLTGLGFLALVLAGAPLTSGALAKSVLKTSLPEEAHLLVLLLAVSAFASTLLMARFLFLVWQQRSGDTTRLPDAAIVAWLAILAVIITFPFAVAGTGLPPADVAPLALGTLLSGIALLAAARLPVSTAIRQRRRAATRLAVRTSIAIHRTAHVIQHLSGSLLRGWQHYSRAVQQTLGDRLAQLPRPGGSKDHWPLAGGLWLGIGGLLLATFMLAG